MAFFLHVTSRCVASDPQEERYENIQHTYQSVIDTLLMSLYTVNGDIAEVHHEIARHDVPDCRAHHLGKDHQ